MSLVNLVIVGAGSRGSGYARLAVESGRARIVGVAEPDPVRRREFQTIHGIPDDAAHADWRELLDARRVADVVVIATPDRGHEHPAIAFAAAGYHILLEKPIAPTEEQSVRIVDAARRNGVILMVCHVMRYSDYSRALKAEIDAGSIGNIVSIEHLEPIGWWHFAHSYVRGNWRLESEASSMLLAKSSHDLDWLSFIVGKRVRRVSSFGGLAHFTPANKPAGAADRCFDCPLMNSCAYSAPTIYKRFLGDPVGERWPLAVLSTDTSAEGIRQALLTGPYGECVFNGQNDVADHQVVNLEFADGSTASFTVTAFTELDFRKTRIFGTSGSIEGDGRRFEVFDFATGARRFVESDTAGGASAADGHGGADGALVNAFLDYVESGAVAAATAQAEQGLESHRIVWAAERARLSGTVIEMIDARIALS